jgi:glycosyltransferase involved in cell wall biosynthesis
LSSRGGNRRVLFVQVTNPGAYPPLIHASTLMADAGWEVTFLSAPTARNRLAVPSHPRVTVRAIRTRPSSEVSKLNYALYTTAAARLALRLRPDVVYASDPLGAGPGLLAARLTGATLVYHEHDSPSPRMLHPLLARWRAAAARSARLIVFPNEGRARIAQGELRFAADRLHVVWNVPRRAEIVSSYRESNTPLLLHYHGNISPQLLPIELRSAIARMAGRVRLRIAGYEAAGAQGYIKHLMDGDVGDPAHALIEYIGMVSRAELLKEAARADVGLSLMPLDSDNYNMNYMAGASNKAFDYMAAGLALLVSDIPDWTRIFVEPGFGLACNPADINSLSAALGWFVDHPEGRRAMAARARNKIETEWNYDTQFLGVLKSLDAT